MKTVKGSNSVTLRVREQGENPHDEKKRRIINAAKAVFLKYGYRRVTMNDLALAAGVSRPALYLVFPKKEDVFCGVVREMAREISEEVNRGLESIKSPIEKLKFVCEIWMIQPFDWVNESPEAKEVYESSHEFAGEAVNESMLSFERDLASALELFPKGTLPKGISHTHAARLLVGAIMGVKKMCTTSDEARKEIHALIAMIVRF
jgi:AcrR family transcriptional regulator